MAKPRKTKSKTLCPYPFMHQHITSTSTVKPCCFSYDTWNNSAEWEKLNFEKGIITPTHKKMRQQMLRGEWPDVCEKCRVQEQAGDLSHRKVGLQRFGFPKTKKITFLDLAFTNTCNLACRMCKPSDSSLLEELYTDQDEFPSWIDRFWPNKKLQQPERKVAYVKTCIKEGLEVLKVTGGEPFACKYFMEVMNWAIENDYAKQLEINLTTNGNKVNKVAIDKLLKFKKVHLLVSIDGTHNVYNYIRHYGDWDKLHNNLKQLALVSDKIEVSIACIAQFYNTTNIERLIFEAAKLKIPVTVDEYIKPSNTEISPYQTDDTIKSILMNQSKQIEKRFKSWKSYSDLDTQQPEWFGRVQFHALKGAKSLYNIAIHKSFDVEKRKQLKNTVRIQDKLYQTDYRNYLQDEQIAFLKGIDNV